MSQKNFISTGADVLKAEAASILGAVEKLDKNFQAAVQTILDHKGKVIICGMGKSGLVAQKIAATLSSTGTPAVFLHAGEAVHGDLGIYEAGDPTLLISNSGATVECVRLMPILKQFKSPTIALVGRVDSPMGQAADLVLDASVSAEADPLGIVPTNSTTVALALGDALACALMRARNFSKTDFARFHPAGQLGRNLILTVDDVMYKAPDCAVATPETSIRQIVIEMTKKPIGAACVLDKSDKLIGIITDGDLRRMLQTVTDIDAQTCGEIMTKKPVCIAAEAHLSEAANLMENRKSKISVLPVIDADNNFKGIIRLHDVYHQ